MKRKIQSAQDKAITEQTDVRAGYQQTTVHRDRIGGDRTCHPPRQDRRAGHELEKRANRFLRCKMRNIPIVSWSKRSTMESPRWTGRESFFTPTVVLRPSSRIPGQKFHWNFPSQPRFSSDREILRKPDRQRSFEQHTGRDYLGLAEGRAGWSAWR